MNDQPKRPASDTLMENTHYYGDESPAALGQGHAANIARKAPIQPRPLDPESVEQRGGVMDNTRYFGF